MAEFCSSSEPLLRELPVRWNAVEHTPAYSPEARGRSERAFGTLQDLLAKELRLFGITDIEEANRYIREIYLPMHNDLFAIDAFVPVREAAGLVDIPCIQQNRVVARRRIPSWALYRPQFRRFRCLMTLMPYPPFLAVTEPALLLLALAQSRCTEHHARQSESRHWVLVSAAVLATFPFGWRSEYGGGLELWSLL
jgi:hypothetical protein